MHATPETRLLDMLSYMRPAGSRAERKFIREYIAPTGARPDARGNYILKVGDSPRIMWASHTDTVHHRGGRQRVEYREGWATAPGSNCLGADDTTGVWLMLEMIRRGVAGLYIFHRAEEIGCQGSSYIVNHTPELLDGIEIVLSFDRRGYDSVVTHQIGYRTASDWFAESLIVQLEDVAPFLSPDCGGVFTDSVEYAHLVRECSNLSVGYFDQHTSRERQDVPYALDLLGALVRMDASKLAVQREPGEDDSKGYSSFGLWDDEDGGEEWGECDSCGEYATDLEPVLDGFGDMCGRCKRYVEVMLAK